jgi:DIS3-like exonuclease 2
MADKELVNPNHHNPLPQELRDAQANERHARRGGHDHPKEFAQGHNHHHDGHRAHHHEGQGQGPNHDLNHQGQRFGRPARQSQWETKNDERHQILRTDQKPQPKKAPVGETSASAEVPPPPPRFPRYVLGSEPEIEDQLRRGELVVGVLSILKWTTGIAFVRNSAFQGDVAIMGVENRMQAFHDDVVIVKLAPRSQWTVRTAQEGAALDVVDAPLLGLAKRDAQAELPDGRKIMRVIDPGRAARGSVHTEEALTEALDLRRHYQWGTALQPCGHVIRVLERNYIRHQPCRLLGATPAGGVRPNNYVKLRCYNDRYPLIGVYGRDIPSSFSEDLGNYLLLAEILVDDEFGEPTIIPNTTLVQGRILVSLGKAGTVVAESKAICAMNFVKDADFTEEVLECVMPDFQVPPADELWAMGRRDLREEEFVCTIDPRTARDLDDALSITKMPSGYRLGVHIADVSYFVPFDSALDHEARARATSVYLVERVIPMLPHKLCEDYCSLNAGCDKFAFSSVFQFNHKGELQSQWFGQSVIRNRCRMAYEDAQSIIDGDETGGSLKFHESEFVNGLTRQDLVDRVVNSVKLLFELAGKLREVRFNRGALSLNKAKIKFSFDVKDSLVAPGGFSLERSHEANWVVEEFMLLANIKVAEKIVEFMPQNALLRKHDAPNRKKLNKFVQIATKMGYNISARTSKGLNDSLEKYAGDPNSDALRLMATYCLSLAKYTCSGDEGEDMPISHYALATPCYTHFTSPIRRYCDLVVHRQLLLSLEIEREVNKAKAKGVKDCDIHVDPLALAYGEYFMNPGDVGAIALNSNTRKEAARKASDQSLQLFFCLYLDAISALAKVDPSVQGVQTAKVIVTKVGEEKFSLLAADIAQDNEIFHNSGSQRWITPNIFDKDSLTFQINWGPAPSGGEEVIETAGLFFECVVALRVVVTNIMKLEMALLPPWERAAALGKVMSALPKKADNNGDDDDE